MTVTAFFKRQRRIYFFYTLLPLLLLGEILIADYPNWLTAEDKWNEISWFCIWLALSIETAIVSIELFAEIRFRWQTKGLTETERLSFRKTPLQTGPILVNDRCIVEYRMFRRRIIPICGIFRAKYQEQKPPQQNWRYQVHFVTKYIVLLRKGKKQIMIKAPKSFFGGETKAVIDAVNTVIEGKEIAESMKREFSGYAGDFPFYGLFVFCMLGLSLLMYRSYIPFMDLFIDRTDAAAYFLYHAGFDRWFRAGAFVLICACAVGCLVWKIRRFGVDLDSYGHNFVVPFGALALLSLHIVFLNGNYGDISAQARADFLAYQRGEYAYIVTKLADGGDYYANNPWLEDMIKERGLVLWKYVSTDHSMKLLQVGEPLELSEGKAYRIAYLENTGVIVEIR